MSTESSNFTQTKLTTQTTRQKTRRLQRQITISSSSSFASSSSSSSSGIFTIHNAPINEPNCAHSLVEQVQLSRYVKHSNLDVRPLSLREKIALARIHYVTIPNAIRTFTVLFCLGWFLFAAYTVLAEYLDHETIIYLEYQSPNTSKPPAITICTHCILCSYPDASVRNISARYMLAKDHIPNLMRQKQMSQNVNIQCLIAPNMITEARSSLDCAKLVPVVNTMQEGRKCFTYFSDIYGQTSRATRDNPKLLLQYDKFPQILLRVTGEFLFGVSTANFNTVQSALLQQEDIHNPSIREQLANFAGIYINVHDPSVLPDMYNMAFRQMMPGKSTIVPFVKRIQRLLPPPYATRCHNYLSKYGNYSTRRIRPETNIRLFRTRGECFLHCMWDQLNKDKCANFYSIYDREMVEMEEENAPKKAVVTMLQGNSPLDNTTTSLQVNGFFKLCAKTDNSFQLYMQTKQKCMDTCPEACMVETFYADSVYDLTSKDLNVGYATVVWAPQAVTHIMHRPKWDLTDFLGTLGGQAHIWLGVSIINIVWFVIRFVRLGEFFEDTSIGAIIRLWRHQPTN